MILLTRPQHDHSHHHHNHHNHNGHIVIPIDNSATEQPYYPPSSYGSIMQSNHRRTSVNPRSGDNFLENLVIFAGIILLGTFAVVLVMILLEADCPKGTPWARRWCWDKRVNTEYKETVLIWIGVRGETVVTFDDSRGIGTCYLIIQASLNSIQVSRFSSVLAPNKEVTLLPLSAHQNPAFQRAFSHPRHCSWLLLQHTVSFHPHIFSSSVYLFPLHSILLRE